jgi:hypothetical protein
VENRYPNPNGYSKCYKHLMKSNELSNCRKLADRLENMRPLTPSLMVKQLAEHSRKSRCRLLYDTTAQAVLYHLNVSRNMDSYLHIRSYFLIIFSYLALPYFFSSFLETLLSLSSSCYSHHARNPFPISLCIADSTPKTPRKWANALFPLSI